MSNADRPSARPYAGKPLTKEQQAAAAEIAEREHLSEATKRELAELDAHENAPKLNLTAEEIAALEKEREIIREDVAFDVASAKLSKPIIAKLRDTVERGASGPVETAPAPERPQSLVAKSIADAPEPIVHEVPPVSERFGLVEPEQPSASPLKLSVSAARFTRAAQTNKAVDRSLIAQKAAETREKLTPGIAATKQTLAAIQALWAQEGEALKELAALDWSSTPRSWSRDLRLRIDRDVFIPAAELVDAFNRTLSSLPQMIALGERLVAQGWQSGEWFAESVRELWRDFTRPGGATDTKSQVMSFENQLGILKTKLATIEAILPPASEEDRRPEVEVLLSGKDRLTKDLALRIVKEKAEAKARPTMAAGMEAPLP